MITVIWEDGFREARSINQLRGLKRKGYSPLFLVCNELPNFNHSMTEERIFVEKLIQHQVCTPPEVSRQVSRIWNQILDERKEQKEFEEKLQELDSRIAELSNSLSELQDIETYINILLNGRSYVITESESLEISKVLFKKRHEEYEKLLKERELLIQSRKK